VNQWKSAAIEWTDQLDKQSLLDVAAEYGRQIGEKLGEAMDDYIHDSVVDTTATHFVSVGGDITEQAILDAKTLLDTDKVPGDNRYLILSAGQANAMLAINKYQSSDFVTTSSGFPTMTGKLTSTIQGCVPIMSTLVNRTVTIGSPSSTRTVNLMFHKEAFAGAVQKAIGLEKRRAANKLADVVIGSVLFGASVARTDHYAIIGTTGS
jgi:hypothetical protein